ncbi:beta-1,3 galactosyltransferase [Schistosoma mansoni]|nr:beta-1,3 galactosyltransferase [Schistosoma mansoni]|eukprot:XP_018645610.1 beta-1,3 galactosyltransferase [Schistosoma mansoni]
MYRIIMSHNRILTCRLSVVTVAATLFTATLILQPVIIIYNYSSIAKHVPKSIDIAYVNTIPGNITLTRDWSFDPTFSKEQNNLSTSNNIHRIFIIPAFSSGSDDLEYPMVVDMPKLVGQVLSNLTVTSSPINDPKFPILISEHQKCNNILLTTGEAPELIILIKSAPSNFLRRNAIRLTWGNDLCWGGRRVIHLFLLGNVPSNNERLKYILKNESYVYHDIIQQDFLDHYYNSTYKIMFGINWAVKYCSNVPIIMFVDDDYFIYPKNVVAYIEGLSTELRKLLISGYVWYNAGPVRKNIGSHDKWLVDDKEYAPRYYPPYVAGGNFFLSMNLARQLNIAMRYTKYLRFDDVYLGIILKKLLHVPMHLKKVYTFHPVNLNSSEIYEMISSHGFGKSVSQFFLWDRLKCSTFCVHSIV